MNEWKHSEMQVSASASRKIRLLNLYAHFTYVKFNVSFEWYTNMVGGGQTLFRQFLHKTVCCAGFILHHNMEWVHFENFDFYFFALVHQCLMSNTLIFFCPFLELWEIILPPTRPDIARCHWVLCANAEWTDCYDAVLCLVMKNVGLWV